MEFENGLMFFAIGIGVLALFFAIGQTGIVYSFNSTQFENNSINISINETWIQSFTDVVNMPSIMGGFYYSNISGRSVSQTLPFYENPVKYYTIPLSQTPLTSGLYVDTVNGTITILENGTYQVDYSFAGSFSTTAQLKSFGVAKTNSSVSNLSISYIPIMTRTPTANFYLSYKQTEYFNFTSNDKIELYYTNGGGSGTATTMVFNSVSLEVRRL